MEPNENISLEQVLQNKTFSFWDTMKDFFTSFEDVGFILFIFCFLMSLLMSFVCYMAWERFRYYGEGTIFKVFMFILLISIPILFIYFVHDARDKITSGSAYTKWVTKKVFPYYKSLPIQEMEQFEYVIVKKTTNNQSGIKSLNPRKEKEYVFGKDEKNTQYVKVIYSMNGKKEMYEGLSIIKKENVEKPVFRFSDQKHDLGHGFEKGKVNVEIILPEKQKNN